MVSLSSGLDQAAKRFIKNEERRKLVAVLASGKPGLHKHVSILS